MAKQLPYFLFTHSLCLLRILIRAQQTIFSARGHLEYSDPKKTCQAFYFSPLTNVSILDTWSLNLTLDNQINRDYSA